MTVQAQRGNGHSVQAPRGRGNRTYSHNNSRVDRSFFLPRGDTDSRLTSPSTVPSTSPFPFPTVTSLLSRSVTPPLFAYRLDRTSVRPFLPPHSVELARPTTRTTINLSPRLIALFIRPPLASLITLPDPASFLSPHVSNAFASFRSLNSNSVTSPHPRVPPPAGISVFPITATQWRSPIRVRLGPGPHSYRDLTVVTLILLLSLSPIRSSRGGYLIPCLRCYPVNFCHSQAPSPSLPAG
jgi:hypothetical protein